MESETASVWEPADAGGKEALAREEETLAPVLAGAFEVTPELDAQTPVRAELRAVVPPPVALSAEELAEALDARRLLVVRVGGGVAYTTLVAVVGGILIHLALAAGFYYGVTLVLHLARGGHDVWAAEDVEGGNGNGGVVVLGENGGTEDSAVIGMGADLQPFAAFKDSLKTPPPERTVSASEKQLAMLDRAVIPTIGIPRPTEGLGAPKVIIPPRTGVRGSPPATMATAAGTMKNTGSSAKGRGSGTGIGLGEGTGDDDEPVFDMMKPGTGRGIGKGRGRGVGDGIDRGASGANLESPLVLEAPQPDIPYDLAVKAYNSKVEFEVLVLPSGKPGEIKLLHSSGSPTLDAVCKAAVARYKFRPAYHAGKPVARPYVCAFTGPGSE